MPKILYDLWSTKRVERVFPENKPCGHKYSKDSSHKFYTTANEQVKLSSSPRNQIIECITTDHRKGNVFTGDRHKQYVRDGFINEQTVTKQINTDSAQKFKSSNFSFWAISIINKTSRSNVILTMWFGNFFYKKRISWFGYRGTENKRQPLQRWFWRKWRDSLNMVQVVHVEKGVQNIFSRHIRRKYCTDLSEKCW